MNKSNSIISSTSDDRSIVIWKVESPFVQNQNTYDHWKNAKITPDYSLYAHKARVWKSIVLQSGNLLSAGEVMIRTLLDYYLVLLYFVVFNNTFIKYLGRSNMLKNFCINLPVGRKQRFSGSQPRLSGRQ